MRVLLGLNLISSPFILEINNKKNRNMAVYQGVVHLLLLFEAFIKQYDHRCFLVYLEIKL